MAGHTPSDNETENVKRTPFFDQHFRDASAVINLKGAVRALRLPATWAGWIARAPIHESRRVGDHQRRLDLAIPNLATMNEIAIPVSKIRRPRKTPKGRSRAPTSLRQPFGHALERARRGDAPRAGRVYEGATFYHHFDLVKEGKSAPPATTIRVCETLS